MPVPPPAQVRSALDSTAEARRAFEEGDYAAALQNYKDALRQHRAFEDTEGIFRCLVNLAAVSRAAGRPGEARQYLDALFRLDAALDPKTAGRAEIRALRSEAAFLQALIACQRGAHGEALDLLAKARPGCAPEMEGRLLNLEARITLTDDPRRAAALARQALRANKRHRQPAETANSARLLAQSLMRGGGPDAEARGLFETALAIDKQQALPGKVSDDLLGLAEWSRTHGQPAEARSFAARALSAADAASDARRSEAARKLLARIGTQP